MAFLVSCLILTSIKVAAHHSYSIYDRSTDVSITGVLTKFDFVQPHIRLALEVVEDDGSKTNWDVETAPIISWERRGFDKDFVEVGDTVTLVGWLAHSGAKQMGLSVIINQDQQEMVVRENRPGGGASGMGGGRANRGDDAERSDSVRRQRSE